MDNRIENSKWLKLQYDRGRSTQNIADELSASRNTVRNRMIKFDIKRRNHGEHFRNVPKSVKQRRKMSESRKAYWDRNPPTDEFKLKISHSKTKSGITVAGRRIYVPGRGRVLEHRLVMENTIGRILESDEQIHHKDGDRLNNHPDNLELLSNSAHQQLHNATRPRGPDGRFVRT